MSRIPTIFKQQKNAAGRDGRGAKTLIPFLTAGDPDVRTTLRMVEAAEHAGAALCELGIPFSDPIADGPVIQESMQYALDHGFKPAQLFQAVADARPRLNLGLVGMVSYSIVHRIGPASFIRQSKQAGFDGFIFPDLPVDESAPARDLVLKEGLTFTLLVAPTTPPQRAERIARACTGFVYVVARAGLTGERGELPADLTNRLQQIRQATDLPIAAGFGISTPQQVRQVTSVADAAIVGSALVRKVAALRATPDQAVQAVTDAVRELAAGLQPATAP
ncbi:MAG: tryptophan synthase subunit alpha [Phycisphaeraceae bacterium]|nr:tryptophan synthase subunit alpha [Phycisphaeraceae bacterium]